MTSFTQKCERTFKFAAIQLRHLVETFPDRFPMYTEKGKWIHGGEAWTNGCERIVDTLTEPKFLAVDTPGWEGILKHGIYHTAKGLGVDESVMWGDYYFLEAVGKALG